MIDAESLGEIIRTYTKHGWILRRVLLTGDLQKSLSSQTSRLFGETEIAESEIDAAWFSRPPQPGEIAWEIRHLSEKPFALLEYADESADDFEKTLSNIEARLTTNVTQKLKT